MANWLRMEGMERETLVYFLFAIVASLILLSLPIFAGSGNPTYLFLLLFAIGIIWFIVRILYYKRLRRQQTQNRQPKATNMPSRR